MSDELIRKLDVIEIMENLIYDMSEVSTIPQLAKSAIEKLEPVNAVELPCKIGDILSGFFSFIGLALLILYHKPHTAKKCGAG